MHSLKSNRTCSHLVPEFSSPSDTCEVHSHPQKISLPVPLISLTNVIYRKRVCPLLRMAPAWSWLYPGASHSGTGGFASVHSRDSFICGLASSTEATLACVASSCFSGSSFPSSQPTALEVLPLAPDASGMPLNHICNILGAKLNHCLTEIILQTSGKAKAASACNRGQAGQAGQVATVYPSQ